MSGPRARSPRLSLTRPRLLAGVCNPPFHFKGFTARGYLIPAGRGVVDKGGHILWYGRRNNIKRCIKQLNQLTTRYAERTTCCTLTPPKPPSQPSHFQTPPKPTAQTLLTRHTRTRGPPPFVHRRVRIAQRLN